MTGQATPAQVGALLGMMQLRGVNVEEITGAVRAMRSKVVAVITPAGMRVIDTCGTGGDHAQTFNISTAAALVAAGAGRPLGMGVVKHGTRSVTSQSGSSQVLEALGVKLKVAPATFTRCLEEAGICFCFAPAHNPAMKHAMPVRQELGFRTIFNMLGPLMNPAGVRRQVMGVFAEELTELMANTLREMGSEHAMVVHGQLGGGLGIDELTTTGVSRVSHVRGGRVETYTLDAITLGLPRVASAELRVEGPDASAAVIRAVLAAQPGPARDIVCLNAAAALLVADLVADLPAGLKMAQQTIDAGAAQKALDTLVRVTQADATPVE